MSKIENNDNQVENIQAWYRIQFAGAEQVYRASIHRRTGTVSGSAKTLEALQTQLIDRLNTLEGGTPDSYNIEFLNGSVLKG